MLWVWDRMGGAGGIYRRGRGDKGIVLGEGDKGGLCFIVVNEDNGAL